MNHRVLRIWKGEKGAALVEFAILLPLLVVLLVGMMEFGLLLYNQQVITNASREGARFGIVSRSPDRWSEAEITDVVNDYCADHLVTFGAITPPSTTFTGHSLAALFGEDLTVTVTFHYDFLVLPNFVGALIGGTDLEAETTMKYE